MRPLSSPPLAPMSLLDLAGLLPQSPILVSGPVRLRAPEVEDFPDWTALREASRRHLTAWEPDWRVDDMTAKAFRTRIRVWRREMRQGSALPLLIVRRSDDALIGGVTLANIRLGASRSASIGYWIGKPFVRNGYARAAISAVLEHAFTTLGLNRLEAACQPENIASRTLLETVGFINEGIARDYLFINGDWRDHLLFAITAAEFTHRRAI